jgi:hypothetical protein
MNSSEEPPKQEFDHAAHAKRLLVLGVITTGFGAVMLSTAQSNRVIWVVFLAMGIGHIVMSFIHRRRAENSTKS